MEKTLEREIKASEEIDARVKCFGMTRTKVVETIMNSVPRQYVKRDGGIYLPSATLGKQATIYFHLGDIQRGYWSSGAATSENGKRRTNFLMWGLGYEPQDPFITELRNLDLLKGHMPLGGLKHAEAPFREIGRSEVETELLPPIVGGLYERVRRLPEEGAIDMLGDVERILVQYNSERRSTEE